MTTMTHISDELVDLLAADVVDSHHGVEGCVAHRGVPVADVHGDLLQALGRRGLAHGQTVALDQQAKLLQTLWGPEGEGGRRGQSWDIHLV